MTSASAILGRTTKSSHAMKKTTESTADAVWRWLRCLVMAFVVIALLYPSIAFAVFQWRNPLSNDMSFFRDFVEVITWQKLPEYQP